ncbi:polyketide synthase protein [Rutstroemia sp. NJR-2017a BBW]|nr:polyketide synthase protein [Rutstroemia sp. NJR-2017a BBW]
MGSNVLNNSAMDHFAIIGLSFKLPREATDETNFWKILSERKNLSTQWPKDRFTTESNFNGKIPHGSVFSDHNLSTYMMYHDQPHSHGAHFLAEDPGLFDAPFFSITPKEAAAMDPQQRMALEAAYHVFENAGIPVEKLRGSHTGVFGATMSDDYAKMMSKDSDIAPPQSVTGGAPGILPNRISWYFDLHGPSVHLDTACSSSMIAVDMACQAMRSGNATTALVLGSNLLITSDSTMLLEQGGFLSPDSKCFSFDARANGYARGEGIVALLLKPLNDALRDGDVIRAVIRGIGSNQDGRTPTLTQPSSEAQEALIRRVYAQAGLGLEDTRYFEAHGTGTSVGDPIEVSAVGKVFAAHRTREEPLLVGSVKANIGHLEGASGGAGIIKAILTLERGIIPPTALFESLNPNIHAESYHIRIPVESTPWPTSDLRRVSVNSFGYGGTNSHIILDDAFHYLQSHGLSGYHHCTVTPSISEEHIVNGAVSTTNPGSGNGASSKTADHTTMPMPKLLIWSASDSGALERMKHAYQEYYQAHIFGSSPKTDQLAYTLAARRSVMPWRTFAVVDGKERPTDKEEVGEGISLLSLAQPVRTSTQKPLISMVFTGQGAQYVGMGLDLLRYPAFEESLRKSDKMLADLGSSWSIFDALRNDQSINRPEFSQPLCTVLQIALVELLSSFGVTPIAVVGHSSGEIAAAYTAGAISHESACKVAYFRGQVIGKLRATTQITGAMISVNIPEPEVAGYLAGLNIGPWKGAVHVSCINSPTNVTLSGPSEAIDMLKDDLDQRGIFAQKLNTGVAYHSPAMLAVADEYLSLIGSLEPCATKSRTPLIHMISSVTGHIVSSKLLATAQYWVDNMVSPVRFADAIKQLSNESQHLDPDELGVISDIIEIGPHAALRRPIKDSLASPLRYHSMLERKKSPLVTTLHVLGTLWCHKHPVSILAGNLQTGGNFPFLVDCPPYPFDHSRRYWVESRLSKDYRLRPSSPGYMLGRRNHDWNTLRPQWRNWLSTEAMPWLGDHIISGKTICPGTGMVVMAIEAAKQEAAANNRPISGLLLKKTQFLAPIVVGESAQTATETVLHLRSIQSAHEKEQTWYEIGIFTYRDERWTQCFSTDIQVQYKETVKVQVDGGLENQLWEKCFSQRSQEAFETCIEKVDNSAFYSFCEEHGIHYGKTFQLLKDIKWDGDQKATALIDLLAFQKEHRVVESPGHPAVLDASIHLLLVQISKGLSEHSATVVPQRMGSLWISADAWTGSTSSLHLNSKLQAENDIPGSHKGSVWAVGDDGSPLCSVDDVILTEVSESSQPTDDSDGKVLLYSIGWKPQLSSLSGKQLQQVCDKAAIVYDETPDDERILKVELAMRLSARNAVREITNSDLERAPSYMQRYLESLKYLYSTLPNGEAKDISDTELGLLLDECEKIPDFEVFSKIGSMLPSILRGSKDPLELMFATKSAEKLYTHLANQQMRDGRFATFLDLASHEKPAIQILEIGAGTGSMARHILGSLDRFEKDTGQYRFASYTYTDISSTFFEAAQKEFGDFHGRLLYKTLDLERDPIKQGFELGSYDLVIAGLVLHATSDLKATLGRVKQLLKPGGHIALQEVVATGSARANVTFGSLPGWWLSTEEWREYTPLLTTDRWGELLLETGFSGAEMVLRDYRSDISHLCSMIVSKSVDTQDSKEIGAPELNVAPEHGQNRIQLFIDGNSESQRTLAAEIRRQNSTTQIVELEHLISGAWWPSSQDVIVSLVEFEMTRLSCLSEQEFKSMKEFIQGLEAILWVSSLPAVDGEMANPFPAIATGFLRSIRSEKPEKHIVNLITEPGPPEATAKHVLRILDTCFGENPASTEIEFAVQNNHLTVGRLMKAIKLDEERSSRIIPQLSTTPWKASPPVKLEVRVPGMLDTLRFVEDTAYNDVLGSNEVEIEAMAWPVNFRDVFVALGRLGMTGLGVECAGVVTRTGNDCHYDMKCGDRVVMISIGCMKSHPRALSDIVVKIPDSLSFTDAVAAANPGITAYHSLINVARLQAGEKILIHSGAGSTGQMAIAIAQWLGAEVFATVGFDEKKELLKERFGIPDDHIFYSRNTSFAKGVMRVTKGYGVDVVLNSLSGEGLRASWECIAPYGRFVEIGKADIGVNSSLPMANFARNTSFSAVDLVHLSITNLKLFRGLIEKVVSLISRGDIGGPAPLHFYPASSVEKAFRYMQSGKNTGRIIITRKEEDLVPKFLTLKSAWTMNANASYVVAGGFGGIGRAILRWMADRGARNLIVPSTSGPSSQAALDVVSELERRGVRVITKICNAASTSDLTALLQDCATSMPPIKGCINSAMVLQDSIFENMTYAQWTKTIRSKVNTSWNLHELLPKDMDFFILLSSIAGIYGSPGQSNYAAGCTFQDALARSRSAAGYRNSVALNLGWMRTIGIIAETKEYQRNRHNVGDMAQVEEVDFFALLEHYCDPSLAPLSPEDSQVLIGVITQEHVQGRGLAPIDVLNRPLYAGFSAPQLYNANKGNSGVLTQEDTAALFQQATTPHERSLVVLSALKAKLARALDVAVEDVDSHRTLADYGTDSLMAVELRNWIRRDFGVSVAIFDLFNGDDIAALSKVIAKG